MQPVQIKELVNTMYTEVTGQAAEGILNEDLSNIVAVGETLMSTTWREKYVNSLLNQIGRMEFVERPYNGIAPDIRRESWEWGSILSKSRTKDFEAVENPSWSLTKGTPVENFPYEPPEVQTTLYNELITWEIDCSFVNRQVKQSFTSVEQFDRFFSMIRSHINNNIVQNLDNLTMRTVNAFIGRRLNTGIGVIDVLAKYNAAFGTNLTAAQAVTNKDFCRYFAYLVLLYRDRMRAKHKVFSENQEGYTTFTPEDYAHVVIHSDLGKAMDIYLQSETYHDTYTKIGKYDTIPYWQSTGSDFDFTVTSRIDITLPGIAPAATVNRNYILGTIFDRDATGVFNQDRRVEVSYNARGEYWSNFYKVDTMLFNDPAENGIVFVAGNGTIS